MSANITSAEHKANIHPFYAKLREESPVYRVMLNRRNHAWLFSRYDDVVSVLKDPRFVKNRFNVRSEEQTAREPWMPAMFKPLLRNMLDLDEPDHTRLRRLVNKAFIPRRIDELQPRIQALCDELLTKLPREGQFDLIRDYALPIPTTIIAEMLGVPVEDRFRFQKWSNAMVSINYSTWSTLRALPNVWFFMRYIRRLIAKRRAEPKDDMLTALCEAEEAGDKLSEDELVAMAVLLLIAGHETTVNLIGNGMLALMTFPDQMERLRNGPEWIRSAVEECLRYDGPLETATERFASEDVTMHGVTIPKGEMVFAGLASANRDERQFPDADRFDITRNPNKHLAFGLGAHFCVGAPLARLEGQIAISSLLKQFTSLVLAVKREALPWRPGLVLHGMKSLPVSCES